MFRHPGGGGGALRYRGGPHPRYVFLFLRPPHVRDFVKEGYFFVPRYEVWGSKSPYNPRNIRGSDAEWLGFRVCCRHLLPLNTQRIIESEVKIRVPVHPMSVFWLKKGCLFSGKNQRFIKIRVIFWPEISALGVSFNFDNERMHPLKYPSAPPPPSGVQAFDKLTVAYKA